MTWHLPNGKEIEWVVMIDPNQKLNARKFMVLG
jgi:hypothetical protein